MFYDTPPELDIPTLEKKVNELIARDLPVMYADESHIRVGDLLQPCSGPRTHVTSTGSIEGFRLYPNIIYDNQRNRYLLIGFVGEDSDMSIRHIQTQDQQSDMMGPFIY